MKYTNTSNSAKLCISHRGFTRSRLHDKQPWLGRR